MVYDPKRLILATLAYADVFDYPLTLQEVYRFIISNKPVKKEEVGKAVKSSKKLAEKNGFFYFKGREGIVKKRQDRQKESDKKLRIAKKAIKFLSNIPTVQFIGISGGLTMNNADPEDDIDLFIITKGKALWTTRFFCILVLEFLGVRRKRGERVVSDKVCLNMFADENFLSLPPIKQNLFIAHEVVQLKPMFDRDNTHGRFINENRWVVRFLPNSLNRRTKRNSTQNNAVSVFMRTILRFSALEFFAKNFQLWYMRKHITTEVISRGFLGFHPFDHEKYIMKKYREGLEKHDLLR